jgi:hypothetical protein
MRKDGKEPKFYYVYLITNTIINKQYIGSKVCYKNDPLNDGYWGSSKYLNEDYKIYGKEKFLKEIITHCKDKFSMLDKETEYIINFNTLSPNGYNRFLPNDRKGFHMSGFKFSDESKQKMRGRKHSDKEKQLMKQNHRNYKKENHPQWGTNLSIHHINKIKKALTGKHLSEQTIKKISIASSGKNNGMFGKTHKEDSIRKNREKALNRPKLTCLHCNKLVDKSNYGRWHGSNCKLNFSYINTI